MAENIEETLSSEIKNEDTNTGNNNGNNGGDGVAAAAVPGGDSSNESVVANEKLNFEALREAKKQAELERDEMRAQLDARNNAPAVPPKDESELEMTRREVRELKQNWKNQRDTAEANKIESQLRETYPDLDKVINKDNLELLKARDKTFSKLVNSRPSGPDDLYHRAIAAYSLIKKYGIHVEDKHVDDRARVAANMAKPRPASAAATTNSEGLAEFSAFTNMNSEERRKAVFKLARERANG